MPRNEIPLTFENLVKLGGGDLAAWWALQIQHAVDDCRDRPAHAQARKVSVVCYIKPLIEDGKPVRTAAVSFECDSKVPKVQSRTYEMKLTHNGLAFNPDIPDSVDQIPLPFGENDKDQD